MLSHHNEMKMVTVVPVDPLLPQEENPVGPDVEERGPSAAQPSRKKGQNRARRARGRRPGAAAATSKNKG